MKQDFQNSPDESTAENSREIFFADDPSDPSGWIKIHRKILQWEWFTEPGAVALFLVLLASANYRPSRWRGVQIGRGELLTGRKILALKTGLSESRVGRLLKKFENSGEVVVKVNNRFSIITICNFNKYQGAKEPERTADEQRMNNKRTASEQQVNTSKKDKNYKKNEEVYTASSEAAPSTSLPVVSNPKKPKPSKPVFSPEGKKKFAEWVYLSPEQFERAKAAYVREGFDGDDWDDGVALLNDWFAQNPQMRAKRVDDGAALRGWVLKELLERRYRRLRLERQEQFQQGGQKR